jgi:disulfide oxidoreductase YuzD
MSEQELLKRIAELEAQNLELLAENERFREMLGLPINNTTTHTETIQLPDIIEQDNTYQKFIVIDNRLVWYGGINLFDIGNSDDTIMRLESRELVAELEAYIK